ncbi:hypothetical protein LHJ74_10010 [Streptomyces sp. N2-109]|uniref:Uncharacterized protein n=1 Tax=Streptomyces gossypii TaxID=2883101 RepID=A0ABT2JQS3_9ACTN|nr:hypothetical protein [Streptomyces gossypii]MCT2590242.1 hypothetical protein [Streptomyces gossypii]
MTESEARRVERMLHRMERPGVAAPSDPLQADGDWRIYDRPEPDLRRDITAEVLDALGGEQEGAATLPVGGRAVRGFIVPA